MRIGQPHEIFPDDCSELYTTGKLKHSELLDYNTPVVLNLEGGAKVLTVSDGEGSLRPIIQRFKGAVKPRNIEQQFLNHFLFDDKIRVVLALGQAGSGKAQPLTAKILTPTGWRTIGDLKVGDFVCSPDGSPTKILGVFPQGKKDIYKVTFSDGSSTRCCKEHLWITQNTNERAAKRPGKIRSTEEIIGTLCRTDGRVRNHSIPIASLSSFSAIPDSELPLDPYTLGALIGDGGMSQNTIQFTSADDEIIEHVSKGLAKVGHSLSKNTGKYGYYVVATERKYRGGIRNILQELGLHGSLSYNKHIPEMYLMASHDSREALLQGLMDTDGTINAGGSLSPTFSTTSKQLAEDVVSLVRSLGGVVPSIRSRYTKYTHKGEKRTGRLSYRMTIKLPNDISPFRLSRKNERITNKTKYFPTRYIDSIVPDGHEEAQCILLDSEDHLYVTDDYIVTHNTLLTVNAALESGKRMIYSRAFTPVGASLGYLPGNVDEKLAPWLLALQDTCEVLGMQEIPADEIECAPITYMRGRSLSNRFVVIDEAQNLTYHEIKTLLTRLGEDCKVVLMGDPSQCDLRDGSQSGFVNVCEKLIDSEIVAAIQLTEVERGIIAALAVDRL